jgi:hypothetical protein
MIPISSAISGGLIWSKTSCKRGYELKCNGEIVASLQRKSFWSSEFQAESARGSWKFRRTGCFRAGTEIVDSNFGTRITILKPNWSGGGTLAFSDGLTFRITSKSLWRQVWTVLGDSGETVLSIHSREVDVPRKLHLSEERLILLAIFSWHIMQQASEDAASVAATLAAIS